MTRSRKAPFRGCRLSRACQQSPPTPHVPGLPCLALASPFMVLGQWPKLLLQLPPRLPPRLPLRLPLRLALRLRLQLSPRPPRRLPPLRPQPLGPKAGGSGLLRPSIPNLPRPPKPLVTPSRPQRPKAGGSGLQRQSPPHLPQPLKPHVVPRLQLLLQRQQRGGPSEKSRSNG